MQLINRPPRSERPSHFSTYDNFGRRTTRIHPDAGQTNYIYDLAGNLTQLETANLIKEGLAIQYAYEFERLTDITYPQNPENNVKYTYGEPGAPDNRAGRIVVQEDASGAQEFFYGPLGEVVKNIRTVVIPQHDEQKYTTQWEYDRWMNVSMISKSVLFFLELLNLFDAFLSRLVKFTIRAFTHEIVQRDLQCIGDFLATSMEGAGPPLSVHCDVT